MNGGINMNKGVSLVSMIITIIVIIILASIVIFTGMDTPEQATFSRFLEELSNIKVAVGTKRANNFENSGDMNDGFSQVTLNDAPDTFVSFIDSSDVGYIVDFDLIDYEPLGLGLGSTDVSEATFGVEDIFVYDKNGTIFYVKGYPNDGLIYYNSRAHN